MNDKKELLREISALKKELHAVKSVKEIVTHEIKPTSGLHSEATAVVLASDWHIEETIRSESVNDLNRYSLGVAQERADSFFQSTLRMLRIFNKDIPITSVVLWLGGDFFSGNIHEELLETCSLRPIDACLKAEEMIASGMEFLLDHFDSKFVVVCSTGNHTRITKKRHYSTESGNSLEHYMYHHLARHFKDYKRVNFVISPSYFTYVKIHGLNVRFHHGSALKYQGGIGGLSVPLLRAIAQWNNGIRADLDCIGHWHTHKDFGRAVVNGSLIGYSPFAIEIKAEFEKPRQAMFLIDKLRGKTVSAPIIV